MRLFLYFMLVFATGVGLVACGQPDVGHRPGQPLSPPTSPPPIPPPSSGGQGATPYAAGIWFREPDGWFGTWFVLLVNDRNEFRGIELPHSIQGRGFIEYESPTLARYGYYGIPPVASPPHIWRSTVVCAADGELLDQGAESARIEGNHACEFSGSAANYRGAIGVYASEPMHRLPASDVPFDIGLFQGSWTNSEAPGADVLTVDDSGSISGQHGISGCVYQGRVFDGGSADQAPLKGGVYDIEWVYRSCSGESAYLNGVLFEGMAYIDNRPNDKAITIVASGSIDGVIGSLYLNYVPY